MANAKARYHVLYAVAMKKLIDYKDSRREEFLSLNTEFMEILNEETEYVSQYTFTALPSHMHRVWSNRRSAIWALARCIHRNIIWAVEKIVQLEKLQDRSHCPEELKAFLKDDQVKARLGNL
jgi:hypothetical protein